MSHILYQIIMANGLALAIDKNNPHQGGILLLQEPNPADPDQQWTYVFDPGTQASILFNPGRNMFAAPSNLEKGAYVVLYEPTQDFGGGGRTWQITSPNGAAIRPPANTDLNLNAFGDSWPVGTKVGIWTWDGGQGNETWTTKIVAR